MDPSEINLLAIVGPTAVGKTALSIYLGQRFGGQVISADSRQIYRYMDIGTAKPTPAERAAVPHHLIDVVDPDEQLTLAHYLHMAQAAIAEVASQGDLPMLVGGTGLYVRALLEGWTVPEVPPDEAFRAHLYAEAERQGHEALHARLAEVDPAAAAHIDARNVRRLIRALEVYEHTGRPISELQGKEPPGYRLLQIGLTMPREQLYQRIDARVERMLIQGVVAEVRGLAERGYDYELPSMSALGYAEIGQYLQGEVSLAEAVALIKRHTRRFVRQQYNWFRLSDPKIRWYSADMLDLEQLSLEVERFIQRSGASES
ncbi:MAG: tRNA (adenosine(37)-N6)-dimethylallyltransferase MiaA [Anaerolineae bacterium]|nr:tRNA (adenosine(37)-N6)-dimethylallyltransferase MiaA [Anaerolineae bacterium]